MSSLEAGIEDGSGDSERLTIESETEGAKAAGADAGAAASDTETFSEIDKRLGHLLDRANKLEAALNKLNCKRINGVQGLDLNLPKVEGQDESFEDAIDLLDSANLCSSENSEIDVHASDDGEIYLDIQED